MDSIREQILEEIDHLTPDQQNQLLAVARQLRASTLPPGTPGAVLLAVRDRFDITLDDVNEIMKAIEEGCENTDWDGWR